MCIRIIASFLVLLLTSCANVTSPLKSQMTGDGKYWILNEPLRFNVNNQEYEVPKGFVTDFASVPPVFWTVFPPCSNYTPAAVVHDYLYWLQPDECNKECADKIFLNAMENADVNPIKRKAIYIAVGTFGKKAWNQNKKLKAKDTIRLVPEDITISDPNETWESIEKRIRAINSSHIAVQN